MKIPEEVTEALNFLEKKGYVAPGIDLVKNRKVANQISNIMVNRFGFRKKRQKLNGETKRGYKKR